MPRRIQLEETRWGKVAFAVSGTGPPMVVDTGWIGDLDAMWRHDGYRSFIEALARHHTVMTYDTPGTGLSDRDQHLTTLDDDVELLEQMTDRLGVSASRPVTIFGSSIAASAAVRYTARHPQRVARLLLHGASARGRDLASSDVGDALIGLILASWGLGSRAVSDLFVPGVRGADLEWFDEWQRSAASPEVVADRLRLYYASDVTDDCGRVSVPTLVLHRSGDKAVPLEHGVRIAGLIPDAQLQTFAGDVHVPFLGDSRSIIEAVEGFLPATRPPAPASMAPYGELTAREVDVAELTVEGLTNAAIGERLGISPRTVETHLNRIREKLGVGTKAEIAAWISRRSGSVD